MNEPARPRAMFPALLKHWRRQRGMSQLDLAIVADVSARHVSFLETGRSRPSPEMVLRLASALGVPLRHVDAMLAAAGYPPAYVAEADALPEIVEAAVSMLMDHHEPFPMFMVDRTYHVLHANRGARRMLAALIGGDPDALPDLNLARLTFDPDGARPFLVNFDEVGREILWRIQREVLADPGADDLRALLDEILDLPTVSPDWRDVDLAMPSDPALVVHLARDGIGLRFLVAVTAFEAPQNVSVESLRIETWFPVDEATAAACRLLADMPPA